MKSIALLEILILIFQKTEGIEPLIYWAANLLLLKLIS